MTVGESGYVEPVNRTEISSALFSQNKDAVFIGLAITSCFMRSQLVGSMQLSLFQEITKTNNFSPFRGALLAASNLLKLPLSIA